MYATASLSRICPIAASTQAVASNNPSPLTTLRASSRSISSVCSRSWSAAVFSERCVAMRASMVAALIGLEM